MVTGAFTLSCNQLTKIDLLPPHTHIHTHPQKSLQKNDVLSFSENTVYENRLIVSNLATRTDLFLRLLSFCCCLPSFWQHDLLWPLQFLIRIGTSCWHALWGAWLEGRPVTMKLICQSRAKP